MFDRLLAPVLAVCLVAALALAGYQTKQAADARKLTAEVNAAFAAYRGTVEKREAEREAQARTDELRTWSKQQEAQNAHYLQIRAAQAGLARARAAAVSLRERADALAAEARCAPSDPPAADGGPATNAAADLLAAMLRRVDDAAGTIGEYADQARAAGQLCERTYDALSP